MLGIILRIAGPATFPRCIWWAEEALLAAKDPAIRACSFPREEKEPHQISVILNCRPSRPFHLYRDIFGAFGKGRPGHFDLPAAERKLVLSAVLNTKILLSMLDGSGLKRASCFPDSPCGFVLPGSSHAGGFICPISNLECSRRGQGGAEGLFRADALPLPGPGCALDVTLDVGGSSTVWKRCDLDIHRIHFYRSLSKHMHGVNRLAFRQGPCEGSIDGDG